MVEILVKYHKTIQKMLGKYQKLNNFIGYSRQDTLENALLGGIILIIIGSLLWLI